MSRRYVFVVALVVAALVAACGATPASTPDPNATTTTAAAPDDGPSDGFDLSVDVCSLLDVAAVQALTGESVDFVTDSRDGACFWGASTPSVSAYVELEMFRRADGIGDFSYLSDRTCERAPVEGVGEEAEGGVCEPDPQTKVYLMVYEQDTLLILLVNEASRALTPGDLVPTMESVLAKLR